MEGHSVAADDDYHGAVQFGQGFAVGLPLGFILDDLTTYDERILTKKSPS